MRYRNDDTSLLAAIVGLVLVTAKLFVTGWLLYVIHHFAVKYW